MMKILHITAEALRGGCEKNCYHFIKGCPQHQHQIIVMGEPGPMTDDWKELGTPPRHLNILTHSMFVFWNTLNQTIHHQSFDVAICWTTIRMPLQLHALRRIPSVKVYLGNPVSDFYKPAKDLALQFFFPSDRSKVTLMACSEYVRHSHQTAGYFDQFVIQVSLNPVAMPESDLERIVLRGSFNIGMVARLDPIKDHRTVIRAFHTIVREVPGAMLHFVGSGVLADELKQFVLDEGLSDRVFFYGDVRNVYQYLQQWNMFVYSTTPSEGLGSVVEEAMANGLPCVLSDLPMLRELAPSEGLARWFTAGDAFGLAEEVILLYKNPEVLTSIGNAAFLHAQQHFGVGRFIEDYLGKVAASNHGN